MAVLCVCPCGRLCVGAVLELPPAMGGSSPQGPQWKGLTQQLLGVGGQGQALETRLKSDSCRVWTRRAGAARAPVEARSSCSSPLPPTVTSRFPWCCSRGGSRASLSRAARKAVPLASGIRSMWGAGLF